MPDAGSWRPLEGPLAAQVLGHGHRVVFLHGFTQTGASWVPVAERVAAAGYEAAVVDLPGHGDSTRVRADLRTTADHLVATTGRGTYVGYSMGGRVLLHLAEMYPHVVLRMALLGATAGIADDHERALRRASDETLAEHLLEIGVAAFLDEWLTQPLFAELVVTDADRADRLRNTAEGLAESLRLCGTGVQVSLWDRLRTINVPTLALAGEHDTKFVPIAERLAASLPKGRFATVPAAGHAAHVQQPDVFATKLVEWLQSTRSVVALVR